MRYRHTLVTTVYPTSTEEISIDILFISSVKVAQTNAIQPHCHCQKTIVLSWGVIVDKPHNKGKIICWAFFFYLKLVKLCPDRYIMYYNRGGTINEFSQRVGLGQSSVSFSNKNLFSGLL